MINLNITPPIPDNEKERLEALFSYEILDTLSEDEFNDITKLASYICKVPIALISLIDDKRQWFKSKVGLNVAETPREISFCQYAILNDYIYEVPNTLENETFKNNPLVTGETNIQFYAGVPLTTPDGFNIGTLCVIDNVPNQLDNEQKMILSALAKHVITQLELKKKNLEFKREIEKLNLQEINKISTELDIYKLALDEISSVVITDTKGTIDFVNDNFCNSTKYSREELIGSDIKKIDSGFLSESFFTKMWKTISSGKIWNGELKSKAKDGSLHWLDVTIIPILNKSGIPIRFLSVRFNITPLKEEKNKTNQFFNLSLDYLCIANRNGYFEKVNPSFASELGYTLKEIYEQPFINFVHPDDVDITLKEVEKLLTGFTTIKFENRYKCKDGTYKNLSWNANFNIESGILYSSARDITDFKIQIDQINDLVVMQESIFNGSSYSNIFTNPDGIIKNINIAGLKLLEYSKEEVIDKMTSISFHDQNEVIKRNADLTVELGHSIIPGFNTLVAKPTELNCSDSNEWTYISKSGKKIPVWLNVTCIKNSKDKIIGYLNIAEDYTAKKQIETDLIDAKNVAEQAVYVKDSFLANMSHEIRTPMNAIVGFTEILAKTNLESNQKDYVKNIQTAGNNLLLIINDILDLSKMDSGKLAIEMQPFNLKNTLKHVYDLLKEKASEKNIDFNLNLDADMPSYVIGDNGRINQIIMNIAGNAIKFTEKGKVTITVKKIAEKNNKVTLIFSIKDTGIGIPENKLKHIFERFTQADDNTTRKFGGTGLGLNIAKQLIEMLGGKIELISVEGKGSEFYFSLDFEIKHEAINELIPESLIYDKKYGPVKILLCEDNELNQRLAENIIENFGFELDIAENGKLGIEMLLKNKYNLVLMDLQMPVLDGYQATRYIREEIKSNIPIIAMTAHSLIGEQEKCLNIGMNSYIAKPFKQMDLFNEILSVLEESNTIENAKKMITDKNVDLSYLKELACGNKDFEKEIIQMFIINVPEDFEILAKALQNNDYVNIADLSHKIKSSFSLFSLDDQLNYLEKLEQESKAKKINNETANEFNFYEKKLKKTISFLENVLINNYL